MTAQSPKTLRTPQHLVDAGVLDTDSALALNDVVGRYAMAISSHALHAMGVNGANGPVGRQYVPSRQELNTAPGELADPIGDHAHSPVKGIVHRYPDRVLLMPTQVCAVYCRFCFRREAVGPAHGGLTDAELTSALHYIRQHPAIWEVILTGGDPLILSARRLQDILSALNDIAHVATIRIHSRVPVATPELIDDALLLALSSSHKPINIAVHCNHADELTADAIAALRKLRTNGVMLFGQTVLLRGVNDSAATLEQLFRGMVAAGVKPYYLHQLDRAPGTSHFEVPLAEGRALVKQLRGKVSGMAQPTYVLDIPGGAGKVPVGPDYVRDDNTIIEDPRGGVHKL